MLLNALVVNYSLVLFVHAQGGINMRTWASICWKCSWYIYALQWQLVLDIMHMNFMKPTDWTLNWNILLAQYCSVEWMDGCETWIMCHNFIYNNIFKYYNMNSNYIRKNTVMRHNNCCLNLGTSTCLGLGDDVLASSWVMWFWGLMSWPCFVVLRGDVLALSWVLKSWGRCLESWGLMSRQHHCASTSALFLYVEHVSLKSLLTLSNCLNSAVMCH